FVPVFTRTGAPARETFVGLVLTGIPGTEMAILNPSLFLPSVSRTFKIGLDGTVNVPFSLLGALGSVLRVWDKTHNLLGELFNASGLQTPVIGPNPTNKNVPMAGDTTVHVYGRPNENERGNVFLLENSTNTVQQVGSTSFAETT